MVFGLLAAIASLACRMVGRPSVPCRHVAPPSMDLQMPPLVPPNDPPSMYDCCCCQSAAYTVFGSLGSMRTSFALVYSSLYNTFWKLRPPSVERNTPRSALGPYG